MSSTKWISPLFLVAALYDGLLGILFLVAPFWAFERFQVAPPNHAGYVQFPAALLMIFGLMFLNVARDPVRQRGLIVYGILLKIAYCGVTGYYWLTAGIPIIWKPFVVVDLVMLVLFVIAYQALGARPASAS